MTNELDVVDESPRALLISGYGHVLLGAAGSAGMVR